MIRKNTLLFTFLFFVILTLDRCANPVTPSGGPKDVTPPKSTECFPPDLSVNFREKMIRIDFDEFVQLKDPKNQVIISPPWLPNTDFRLRGKTLVIKLNDTLHANTTYAINFGDAISDITENNILKNFTYVFSTGSYLDSLSFQGRIVDAFNLTAQKDVLAMLYVDNNDTIPFDSLPFKVRPYYLTRTNDNGDFLLTNLSEKSFRLIGLKDLNSSFTYDLPEEKIAFSDSMVKGSYIAPASNDTAKKDTAEVSPEITPLMTFRLFQQYDSIQRLLRSDLPQESQVTLFYRYPLHQPEFIPLNFTPEPGWCIEDICKSRDTVNLWLNNITQDSLILRVVDCDSTLDTIAIDLKKKEKTKSKKDAEKVKRLAVKANCPAGFLKQFTNDLILTFSYPMAKYDLSSILLVSGEDTLKPKAVIADSLKRSIRIFHKWKEDKRYKVILPDSSFYSFNNLTNDTLIIPFKTRASRDFGSLKVTVNAQDSTAHYIVQLLNDKEVILDERRLSGHAVINFEYLDTRTYKLKAISDRNNNGHWDTGILMKKIQPEEVIYFPKVLEIRANWEVEETWDL